MEDPGFSGFDNVLLISLDCVRPEALGCYPDTFAYRQTFPYRCSTPNIDSIASEGILFRNAFCQAPFTPASHASVFTGLNPYRHGIRGMFGYTLRDNINTVAERFQEQGFETGAFVGAHALGSQYGLDRGFDVYDEEFESSRDNWVLGHRRPCKEVTDRAISWMKAAGNGFFGFLHYFDAHDAMSNVSASGSDGQNGSPNESALRQAYDLLRPVDRLLGKPLSRLWRAKRRIRTEIPYGRRYHLQQVSKVDEQIARITSFLKEQNIYYDTLVVIFADHGDAFGEHGEFSHREYLYDTTLHVPFIVKPPGGAQGQHHSQLVRLVDIYPTIVSALDSDPADVDGVSLNEVAKNDQLKAYAETRHERSPERPTDLEKKYVGLRSKQWKLIVDQLDHECELYDLREGINETEDVSDAFPEVVESLEAELSDRLSNAVTDSPDMSNEEIDSVTDRLEGLGYL